MNKSNIILVGIFISLTACVQQSSIENESEVLPEGSKNRVTISQAQADRIGVKIGEIEEVEMIHSVNATGHFEVPPQNRILISPYIQGIISEIMVLEGQKVRKNEVIATIGGPHFIDLQEEYLVLLSNTNFLKENFERQKTLRAEKVNSQKTLAEAEAAYSTNRSKISSLEKQLSQLNIDLELLQNHQIQNSFPLLTPIGGFITNMEAVRGEDVQPGEALFEVVDMDHMHLELKVFESNAALLEIGQKVNYQVPSLSSRILVGDIFLINRSLDEDRSVNTHVHLDENDKRNIFPGMYGDAEIIISNKKTTAIPMDGIAGEEGQAYAFTLVENSDEHITFEVIEIESGLRNEDWIEIKSDNVGIDDKLVTGGAYHLYDAWRSSQ